MADLQELFSRLKAQSAEQLTTQSQPSPKQPLWALPQHTYQQPSVSSPLFSPPIHTPNPIHSSNVISPVQPSSTIGTPAPDQKRANNLLNLLKFTGQPGQSAAANASPLASLQNIGASRNSPAHAASIETRDPSGNRPLSASDLMGTLQRQTSATGAQPSSLGQAGLQSQAPPPSNPQDILLNLLTKPKAQPPHIQPIGTPEAKKADTADVNSPGIKDLTKRLAETAVTNADHLREATPVQALDPLASIVAQDEEGQPGKGNVFNYINPFDQLHTSSPLNHAAKSSSSSEPKKLEILKHGRDISSSLSTQSNMPATKSRKLDDSETVTQPRPVQLENKNRSVSEALDGVREKVDKQVEKALADADVWTAHPTPTPATKLQSSVKKETSISDDVESSWESAGDEDDSTKLADYLVEVYNFPMKPFVSLQIKDTPKVRAIRQDNFMVIAQLKKEFDQIDRCLVTASQTHIVYSQVATKKDNGGFRVIRQDSGDHKQVYRSSGERIFSVQLCTAPGAPAGVETVLGTGVNGSVFWTSLDKSRGDVFADDDVEAQGFIMPPITTAEENTSGSPVKTRAKLSSRHPDFFAVARGKQIYIIAPNAAKGPSYYDIASRKVNSEKYFAERCLKINTGKAGKDFCFSEDDTVIASLDKNGRFKFWDIRELTSRAGDPAADKHDMLELREPLWTMNAAASGSKPEEKPSVSSIIFLDKERPVSRGSASRYIIIGFKQNHILQLWDLGLGKAVQEIRLPHEKDSDGICSISYHPKTGIVAIGHPTRNSIYFIHLSAPKYNIPHMEQARYISMVARNDPALPKPESTAIMSGLREFSFAKAGQLRSVDMLKTPVENASERNSADETMFELYVMHSKGIVGISIKRQDLGWDAQSKMVNPKDAMDEGLIEISDLIQPPRLPVFSEQSSNADATPKTAAKPVKQVTTTKTEAKKDLAAVPATSNETRSKEAVVDKSAKQIPNQISVPELVTPLPTTEMVPPVQPVHISAAGAVAPTVPDSNMTAATLATEQIQVAFKEQFDSLYQRIDSDKRVQDAAAGAKQEALLRLVSSTLTENVDQSLHTIIATRIEKDVIPVLAESTNKLIDRKLAELLPQHLGASISGALRTALPNALQQAMKDKDFHRNIADVTSKQVATIVQQQVSQQLQQALPSMASQAAQKMVSDLEARTTKQFQQAASQKQEDNRKIEELTQLVQSLSAAMQNMAESQSAFQAQMLKLQREDKTLSATQPSEASAEHDPSSAVARTRTPPDDPEDEEITHMTQLLTSGRYEEATIQWISSDHQAEIFDKLFVRVDPSYLQLLSPLVALTVSAAITSSFDTFTEKRLEWLGRVLSGINIRDAEIMDVAPKIMDVLAQRLQGVYIELSEAEPGNACLKDIAALNRQVAEISRLAA